MLTGKVKGALAWGGLALILAVPSADIISANMGAPKTGSGETAAPEITTASVDGVKTVVPVIKTLPVPVNGKPMPDYISDPEEPATAVTTPVAPKPAPVVEQKPAVQTAVIPPQPMPAHMRPLPPMTTPPAAQPPTGVATAQQPMTDTQPLILDEQQVMANEASIDPPARNDNVPRPPGLVGEEDLEDWDSGSLADYLERKGLLSEATYSERTVANEEYDEDGFFLSDGPNQPRRNRRDFDDGDSFIVFPFD